MVARVRPYCDKFKKPDRSRPSDHRCKTFRHCRGKRTGRCCEQININTGALNMNTLNKVVAAVLMAIATGISGSALAE